LAKPLNAVYVSYEEAQKLIPIFRYYTHEASWKDVRSDASRILKELRDVRNISYRLGGQQIFLTEEQYRFFNDVREEVE